VTGRTARVAIPSTQPSVLGELIGMPDPVPVTAPATVPAAQPTPAPTGEAAIGEPPEQQSTVRPAGKPEPPEPANSQNEKLPAYAPHWLLERLRNTVVALQRLPQAAEDAPATLSELCQTACLREVWRLEAEYNGGAPFPVRARRKLRTGRPIQ
jgi:hypothetical protein